MQQPEIAETELKQKLIQILKAVSAFCDNNGIKYYLAYGTLLGAIRHKGFIPWDDDIDLWMPRPDYIRFTEMFHHQTFKFRCPENTPTWPLNFGKVCDEHYSAIDRFGNDFGIYIDIFPIDGLPENPLRRVLFWWHIRIIEHIWSSQLFTNKENFSLKNGFLLNTKILVSRILGTIIPFKRTRESLNRLYRKFCFETAKQVSCLSEVPVVFDRSLFDNVALGEFECSQYRIPKDFHTCLTLLYGDYMTPPKDKSSAHGFVLKEKDDSQKESLTY